MLKEADAFKATDVDASLDTADKLQAMKAKVEGRVESANGAVKAKGEKATNAKAAKDIACAGQLYKTSACDSAKKLVEAALNDYDQAVYDAAAVKAKLDVYAPLADKAKADAAAKAVAEKKNADAALKNALDGANRAADQASAALDNAETKLAELQAAYTKNCEAAPDTAGCPRDKKELDAQTKKASDAKDELDAAKESLREAEADAAVERAASMAEASPAEREKMAEEDAEKAVAAVAAAKTKKAAAATKKVAACASDEDSTECKTAAEELAKAITELEEAQLVNETADANYTAAQAANAENRGPAVKEDAPTTATTALPPAAEEGTGDDSSSNTVIMVVVVVVVLACILLACGAAIAYHRYTIAGANAEIRVRAQGKFVPCTCVACTLAMGDRQHSRARACAHPAAGDRVGVVVGSFGPQRSDVDVDAAFCARSPQPTSW